METEYICHPMGTSVPVQGVLFPVLLAFFSVIMSWLVPTDVIIGRYAISDQLPGLMHLNGHWRFVSVSYLGIR